MRDMEHEMDGGNFFPTLAWIPLRQGSTSRLRNQIWRIFLRRVDRRTTSFDSDSNNSFTSFSPLLAHSSSSCPTTTSLPITSLPSAYLSSLTPLSSSVVSSNSATQIRCSSTTTTTIPNPTTSNINLIIFPSSPPTALSLSVASSNSATQIPCYSTFTITNPTTSIVTITSTNQFNPDYADSDDNIYSAIKTTLLEQQYHHHHHHHHHYHHHHQQQQQQHQDNQDHQRITLDLSSINSSYLYLINIAPGSADKEGDRCEVVPKQDLKKLIRMEEQRIDYGEEGYDVWVECGDMWCDTKYNGSNNNKDDDMENFSPSHSYSRDDTDRPPTNNTNNTNSNSSNVSPKPH